MWSKFIDWYNTDFLAMVATGQNVYNPLGVVSSGAPSFVEGLENTVGSIIPGIGKLWPVILVLVLIYLIVKRFI